MTIGEIICLVFLVIFVLLVVAFVINRIKIAILRHKITKIFEDEEADIETVKNMVRDVRYQHDKDIVKSRLESFTNDVTSLSAKVDTLVEKERKMRDKWM